MKVRIKKIPSKKTGGTPHHSGPQTPPGDAMSDPRTGKFKGGNTPEIKMHRTLQPTSKENATLEAEVGETVITNLQHEGIPEFYKIAGKRHSQGGTPLNLPKDSFIFSRDNKLKIKDEAVLNMFGKKGKAAKKAYTPAELSKKYDINFYREILANPYTDTMQRETAELMIQNYNLKLGALALTQESMKGFDSGIPAVAMGYMEATGMNPEDFMLEEAPNEEEGVQQFRGGGALRQGARRVKIKTLPRPNFKPGGIFSGIFGKGKKDRGNKANTPGGFKPNLKGAADASHGYNSAATNFAQVPPGTTWGTDADGWEHSYKPGYGEGTSEKKTKRRLNLNLGFGRGRTEEPQQTECPEGHYFDDEQQTCVAKFRPRSQGELASKMRELNNSGNSITRPDTRSEAPAEKQNSWVRNQNENSSYTFGPEDNSVMRDGGVPSFKPGGPTSSKTTLKQNIPKGSRTWDASKPNYDASKVREGDYVLQEGRWRKVTGYSKTKYEGDFSDENFDEANTRDYGLIQDKFQDPALRAAVFKQYQIQMKAAKPGRNLTAKQIKDALALDETAVMDIFLRKTKQNIAVSQKYGDLTGAERKKWDKGSGQKYAKEAVEGLGYKNLSVTEIATFQGVYEALDVMKKNPEYEGMLGDFALAQGGMADEGADGKQPISAIDGWDGNTTSGEMLLPRAGEMLTEDVEDLELQVDDQPKGMPPLSQSKYNPFWTQDLNNIAGDFGNLMSIKKHKPWSPPPAWRAANPTFVDFRGAANRNASQIAGITKAASNFGPGSFAAIANSTQATGSDATLKLQEREEATNTATQNQFELANMQSLNNFEQLKNRWATKQWDKNTIMNQNFDNSKMALRNNLRASINNAWTNRGKTQTMNDQFADQFSVDPVTGFTNFTGDGREIDPATAQKAISDQAITLKNNNAGMTYDQAYKYITGNNGVQTAATRIPKGVQSPGYPGAATAQGPGNYPGQT